MLKKQLKKYFGHTDFKELQEEVVCSIVDRNDTLMVVSTGSGKSLCYQLPGMILDGVTIVISPLISLMQDQVQSLKDKGMSAEFIAAYMDATEAWRIRDEAIDGKIKFLFVSPERVVTDKFQTFLSKLNVSIFAIDEAHCLSQWGNDFRESYMQLGNLKTNFPEATICAFTASATKKVRKDIIKHLNMESPKVVVGSTFRSNINISVEERVSLGYSRLLELVEKFEDDQGIVYAFSRKDVDKFTKELNKRTIDGKKVKALSYHAGMTDRERKETLDKFMAGDVQVVVATVAFGMGIDKSNIRYVCHMHVPRSMEGYYQEIGRAGRDGKYSEALLLFSYADIKKIEFIIKKNDTGKLKVENLLQMDIMKDYVYTNNCRHKVVGRHFNDKLERCGDMCDNC